MSTSPEFLCLLCSKSVDLTIDLVTDEMGKSVHQQCYVDKIIGGEFAETLRSRVA
jgi:hypothetical protein